MEIAIVGLGCRFPNARDPLGYWELIRNGTVTFRPIPGSRWDHSLFYDETTRIVALRRPETFIARLPFLAAQKIADFR